MTSAAISPAGPPPMTTTPGAEFWFMLHLLENQGRYCRGRRRELEDRVEALSKPGHMRRKKYGRLQICRRQRAACHITHHTSHTHQPNNRSAPQLLQLRLVERLGLHVKLDRGAHLPLDDHRERCRRAGRSHRSV